jgi:hypothetical protein
VFVYESSANSARVVYERLMCLDLVKTDLVRLHVELFMRYIRRLTGWRFQIHQVLPYFVCTSCAFESIILCSTCLMTEGLSSLICNIKVMMMLKLVTIISLNT